MAQRWTFFRDGLKIDPNEIVGNFQRLRLGTVLPRAGTTTAAFTSGSLDLGSDSFRWRDLYAGSLDVNSTTNAQAITANLFSIHGSGTVYVTNEFKHPSNMTQSSGSVAGSAGPLITTTATYIEAIRVTIPPNTSASDWTTTSLPTSPGTKIVQLWMLGPSGLTTTSVVGPDAAGKQYIPTVGTGGAVRLDTSKIVGAGGTNTSGNTLTCYMFVRYLA